MPRLQRKSFATPDEVRMFPSGHIDVVQLDDTTIGRFRLKPGWRWSQDVAPVVRTSSCRIRHIGYAISGKLEVTMTDGTQLVIEAGATRTRSRPDPGRLARSRRCGPIAASTS